MSALLDSETTQSGGRQPAAPLHPELARRLLIVAFRPAVVALTLVAAIVVVTLVAANSDLTGLAGAVATGWLAVHQVQFTVGITTVGVLPMLPTAILLWSVARTCAKVVQPTSSRRELAFVVAAAAAGPLLVAIVCLAVIADASTVLPLASPPPLPAVAWVLVVNAGGAVAGIAWSSLRSPAAETDVPNWVASAGVAAIAAGRRLAIGAAVVTCLSLIASWPVAAEVYSKADGLGGAVGLTLLSIAYFPNVVVGTAAVLTGASANFGDASVSLFGVIGGPVPGVPVLAAVPTGDPRTWWLGLLAVAAYVAVRAGRDCAAATPGRLQAAKSTALAAVFVGAAATLLAIMSGGSLGVFGYVGADAVMFGAMSTGWVLLLGATTALLLGTDPAPEEEVERSEPSEVVAEPSAIDAEIVAEPVAIESASARVDDPNEPVDAEVVDLPESGGETAD